METDKLTNEELAEYLGNICANCKGSVHNDSLACIKEAQKRILEITAKDQKVAKAKEEIKRWKEGIKTTGFPSKEAIRIAQAVEDGLIVASNFTKYGNWHDAYIAFCKAEGIQNVKDGFKWLYKAES